MNPIPYFVIVAYWFETNIINNPENSDNFFLPNWKLALDLHWYKLLTAGGATGDAIGGILIVGWETYFSMPEAAWANRIPLVLTGKPTERAEQLREVGRPIPLMFMSMEAAIESADKLAAEHGLSHVWVAGGGSVYEDAMDPDSALGRRVTTVYATEVIGGQDEPGTREFPKVQTDPRWEPKGDPEKFTREQADEKMRSVRPTFKGKHTHSFQRVIYRKRTANHT